MHEYKTLIYLCGFILPFFCYLSVYYSSFDRSTTHMSVYVPICPSAHLPTCQPINRSKAGVLPEYTYGDRELTALAGGGFDYHDVPPSPSPGGSSGGGGLAGAFGSETDMVGIGSYATGE